MHPRTGTAVGILIFGLMLASGALAAPKSSPFKRPDQAFRARKDDARAFEALNGYREIWADSGHSSVEAGWKLAMTCYFTGLRLTHDDAAKEKIFREGVEAATAAAKLEP